MCARTWPRCRLQRWRERDDTHLGTSQAPIGPRHPRGGTILAEPGRGEGQRGRAAEGQPGGQGRLSCHGGGAAPAGAERAPVGRDSAPAGAVHPRGGLGHPRGGSGHPRARAFGPRGSTGPTSAGARRAGGGRGHPQAPGPGDHSALGRASPRGCVL
jgi:hypothetical protein